MFKALIIDDELPGAKALQHMLYKYCPEIDVKTIATTGSRGIEAVRECRPDLVFLDIEMPILDGFGLLEEVKDIPFEIIFTTAYDHYAINAIKHNAIDYLLKPVDSDELIEAVRKVEVKLRSGRSGLGRIEDLIAQLNDEKKPQKLAIHNFEGIVFIDISKIIRLNADSNYTHIFLTDQSKHTVSKTLKEYESLLDGQNFFRVHNAHLINLSYVDKYIKSEGGYVVMADGHSIEVSRKKKNDLLKLLVEQ